MKREGVILAALALIFAAGCSSDICHGCNGTGKCSVCKGTGYILSASCSMCGGSGKCVYCGGTGSIVDIGF